jgi:hypothetical protein
MSHPSKQCFSNYRAIMLVISFGYVSGAALSFGVLYLDFLNVVESQVGKYTLAMFGLGMLGASMYCSQWWAKDMEEAIAEPKYLPHQFDYFGYITTIIGGGISGVVFFMVLRVTSGIALTTDGTLAVRPVAGFVVAFCSGLAQFRIQKALAALAVKWTKQVDKRHDASVEKRNTSPKKPKGTASKANGSTDKPNSPAKDSDGAVEKPEATAEKLDGAAVTAAAPTKPGDS